MPANVIEQHVAATDKAEKFAELSLDDVVNDILAGEKAKRRQKLMDNLKAAGLGGDAIFGELESFDADEPMINRPMTPEGGWTGPIPVNFADFISNDRGKLAVLDYAYAAANDGAKRPKVSNREATAIIAKLVEPFGFTFGPPDPPAGKAAEGTPPNSPAPTLQGYGAP